VDPDNRRPVDFGLRHRLLGELKRLTPEEILSRMDEGLPKLWVIHQALSLRKRLSRVFASGSYRPVSANGERADHVVAFSRNQEVVTLVPRLLVSMGGGWEGTWVELPPGQWKNRLTGDDVEGGRTAVHDLLSRFPVALLSKED
jgi:(1->4)-alpha-D-glucan 1-alpha-D-glucosylmutase